MSDQAAPMNESEMEDIGAALAAAGSQAQDNPGGAGSSSAGSGSGAGKSDPAKVAAPQMQSLDFILDIPLKVTVELGRAKMPIRDVLQLAQGSVVELSKFAGEPLEVLVNEKLIARGEVVVVNEKFGIRLTDIISPVERIEQLK